MVKERLKKWGLNLLISLPIIPIGLVIFYLNQYSGIDIRLRLYVSLIIIFLYLAIMFLGFYFVNNKKKIGSAIVILVSIVSLIGSSYSAYINIRLYHTLNQMVRTQTEANYSVVRMVDGDIESISDLHRGIIATLDFSDYKVVDAIEKFLEEEGLAGLNNIVRYDSPIAMVHALYSGEIDAMIIGSNFAALFSENRGFENIETETYVMHTFTVVTENVMPNNNLLAEEPFSILLLGTNSMKEGYIHSGQVNTLILTTINPQNLSVTMTSVPRDSFVKVPCFNYVEDKLSHTHAGGTMCVVQTVEHMFDVEIPYYVKLNFRGMVELVDTLGGIEVDVPVRIREQNSRRQFGEHMITVEEGLQRLDGEQALALSRHRRTLPNQDLGRASHQQLVLEGILNTILTEVSTVNEMLAILNVLGDNLDTNMSVSEMTAIIQYLLELVPTFVNSNPLDEIHIKNMVLSGEIGWAHTIHYSFPLSVIFPFEGAIADARELMLINLGEIEPGFNHSFTFNGFEESHTTRWVQPFYDEPSRNQVFR